MGNLIDYLLWQGQISFANMPFNDMDSMVLSTLGYIDFSKVLTKNDSLSFSEAIAKLKEKETPRFLALDYPFKKELYSQFLDVVLRSKRFCDLLVHDYVDIHDEAKTTQFAAISFTLKKDLEAIVYRGTDETLVGWKEDCMLSFMKAPCQESALSYMKEILGKTKNAYIMGHSKGGNLALFASLNSSEEELKQIQEIYLLDGPGLCKDVFPEVATHRIDEKVHAFEPEFDVVAKIFKMDFSNTTILKSDEEGLMCHGLLSWQIKDGVFLTATENAPEAVWIQSSIDTLVENLTPKEREAFVNTMFDALGKNGAKTLFELGKNPVSTFENVLIKTFHITKKNKTARRKIGLSLFFGTSIKDLKNIRKLSEFFFSNIFFGIVMIFFGIVFLAMPKSALPITAVSIVTVLLALELAIFIYEMVKTKWDIKRQKIRLFFLLFSFVLYGALWVKDGNITFFANWLYGIFFLLFGILSSETLEKNKKKSIFDLIWNLLEVVLYLVIGCYLLYAPEQFQSIGTFVTGCVLICDGGMKIIR